MSLRERLGAILGRRPADAPNSGDELASLRAAYARQLEALGQVRRDVVEAVTVRRRIEAEAERLEAARVALEARAATLAADDRDDDARAALRRARDLETRLIDLGDTIEKLREHGAALEQSSERLHTRVERFRLDLEQLEARRLAVRARERARAAESEVGRELADASSEAKRALDEVARAQATTHALAELAASPATTAKTGEARET